MVGEHDISSSRLWRERFSLHQAAPWCLVDEFTCTGPWFNTEPQLSTWLFANLYQPLHLLRLLLTSKSPHCLPNPSLKHCFTDLTLLVPSSVITLLLLLSPYIYGSSFQFSVLINNRAHSHTPTTFAKQHLNHVEEDDLDR